MMTLLYNGRIIEDHSGIWTGAETGVNYFGRLGTPLYNADGTLIVTPKDEIDSMMETINNQYKRRRL